jgi:hypothetical protein|tara:strand:- start:486 stop:635 length:150 start_codon:yes stop_codon:yes gene_type:complete
MHGDIGNINNFMLDKTPKEEEKENQSFIGPEPLPDFDDEGEEVEPDGHY